MENEAILFRKIQEGDWTAFALFFKAHAEQLYLYALAFVKEKTLAEDIVQEAFIYLWIHRARISYTGSVYAYLMQSVKNACINYKTHLEVEEKYQKVALLTEDRDESENEWEEMRQKVMQAVESLPAKCREIFILGAIEGMKYQEIAEKLDISVNTVKTQMKQAYRKIKKQVGSDTMVYTVLFFGNIFTQRGI